MITIDLHDEQVTPTEKPAHREKMTAHQSRSGVLDRIYNRALSPHHDLLETAHTARLLKAAREDTPSIDVQRYAEHLNGENLSLAERYIRRQVW